MPFTHSMGSQEVLRELLSFRADLNGCDPQTGRQPLAAAAVGNHFAAVSALLAARAAVNGCDASGATALTWAASSGCSRVLLLLLGAAADVQLADEEGGTPLVWG